MRSTLESCLVREAVWNTTDWAVHGNDNYIVELTKPMIDYYASATFALQPPFLFKLLMLFGNAYLISLGLLVFDGSRDWVFLGPNHGKGKDEDEATGEDNAEEATVEDATTKAKEQVEAKLEKAQELAAGAAKMQALVSEGKPSATSDIADIKIQLDGAKDVAPPEMPSADMLMQKSQAMLAKHGDKWADKYLGPPLTKDMFTHDTMGAGDAESKKYKGRLPFAAPHYFFARWLVFGVGFGMWPTLGPVNLLIALIWTVAVGFVAAVLLKAVWKKIYTEYVEDADNPTKMTCALAAAITFAFIMYGAWSMVAYVDGSIAGISVAVAFVGFLIPASWRFIHEYWDDVIDCKTQMRIASCLEKCDDKCDDTCSCSCALEDKLCEEETCTSAASVLSKAFLVCAAILLLLWPFAGFTTLGGTENRGVAAAWAAAGIAAYLIPYAWRAAGDLFDDIDIEIWEYDVETPVKVFIVKIALLLLLFGPLLLFPSTVAHGGSLRGCCHGPRTLWRLHRDGELGGEQERTIGYEEERCKVQMGPVPEHLRWTCRGGSRLDEQGLHLPNQ